MDSNNGIGSGREFLGAVDLSMSDFDLVALCVKIAKANGIGETTVDELQEIAADLGTVFSQEQLDALLRI